MICAVQNNLCEMPVAMLLNIEDHVSLDDSWIVQVQLVYLVYGMQPDRLSEGEMPGIHSNRNVNICSLHGLFFLVGGHKLLSGQSLCPLFILGLMLQLHTEALSKIYSAGHRIVDQKFLGTMGFHTPLKNEVSSIHYGKRLTHIVVGNEDP